MSSHHPPEKRPVRPNQAEKCDYDGVNLDFSQLWPPVTPKTRRMMKCIAGACFGLYVLELVMRLAKITFLSEWIPSKLVAMLGSFLFLGFSNISYGLLSALRWVWDFLIELELWRELVNSLSVFGRVVDVVLSPVGFLFGVASYMFSETVFGSHLPESLAAMLPEIRSGWDFLLGFFDPQWFPSLFVPTLIALVLIIPAGIGVFYLKERMARVIQRRKIE